MVATECGDHTGTTLLVGPVGVNVRVYEGGSFNVKVMAEICMRCGYRRALDTTIPVPDLKRVVKV